jgi:hypothetical protein
MAVEIDAIQSAKSIGWTDALLSRLAANSVGLNARLSLTTPPANATVLSSTGYSLTGSNAQSMIDLAGTWNTSGTPTLIKANVTDTASNAASVLMDLQVGGVSRINVVKNGTVNFTGYLHNVFSTTYNVPNYRVGAIENPTGLGCSGTVTATIISNSVGIIGFHFNNGVIVKSNLPISWGSNEVNGAGDTFLYRDAANTLAQRNGANAQAFNIYNTYTSGSVYERGFMRWVSNVLEIGTEHVGASARALVFKTNDTTRLTIPSTGGAVFAASIVVGSTSPLIFAGRVYMTPSSDGVLRLENNAGGDFNRLQFGGTSSSFPSLKRSSTVLQSRLADDSDFAPLQGRLRSHANATSETVTPTHTIRLFDAAGTEYRVPAIAV